MYNRDSDARDARRPAVLSVPASVIAIKPADAVAAAPTPTPSKQTEITFQKSYDGTAVSDWRCEL